MNQPQHLFHLEYKGIPFKQVPFSKYLEVNLDSKLHWGTHIAKTSEKCLKPLNLLKKLTATKWGSTQEVLTTVYKTYAHPVLDYDCEGIYPGNPAKVVFFIESQAAILALISNTVLTQFSAELKLQNSSHMAGLRLYSESQVMLGFPAKK
ncbi:hypothetical protein TNCV_1342941 [Trichonephila clavipes]|nr:hypothetical protein TNCV_1342941 [Trichonephila clavipes]